MCKVVGGLPEDGISFLDGDGNVVLSTARDGGCLTLPEEKRILVVSGDGQSDDLLASGVT